MFMVIMIPAIDNLYDILGVNPFRKSYQRRSRK